MTRRMLAFGLAGLMVTVLGCGSPFDEPSRSLPFAPISTMECCEGFSQAKFADLVGVPVVETAHDELDLAEDGFRLRVEASAVGRGVRPGPAKAAGIGTKYYKPQKPDAKHELLSALLTLTAVDPVVTEQGYGHTSRSASAVVVAIDDPDLSSAGVGLSWDDDEEPPGATTMVVLAVVPIGSTVIMCAEVFGDEQPWLNLRTGRFQPKPKDSHGCSQRYYPSPTPRSSRPAR